MFEVLVEVDRKGTERCREINYSGSQRLRKSFWLVTAEKIVKMFHIDARTAKQAKRKAGKYGRPISVCKPDVERIIGFAENLILDQPVNPYENALAMDEMIWKKKRVNRIKNRAKDQKSID